MNSISFPRSISSVSAASASLARSSSDRDFFGSPATMMSSDAPTAPARAAAEPPPGVGVGALNAFRTSRRGLSISMADQFPAFGELGIYGFGDLVGGELGIC